MILFHTDPDAEGDETFERLAEEFHDDDPDDVAPIGELRLCARCGAIVAARHMRRACTSPGAWTDDGLPIDEVICPACFSELAERER